MAQAMSEQYSRRNNIELAGIPNSIRDNDLEETIINICKEHRIDISPVDIEACNRVPLSNAQATQDLNQCKRIIIKFVNCKLPERLLQIKNDKLRELYNRLNITDRVSVNTLLCPYYRFLQGQRKLLVSKKKIHQVFCLRDVVSIKVYETSHPKKIFHIRDIPVFPEEVDEEEQSLLFIQCSKQREISSRHFACLLVGITASQLLLTCFCSGAVVQTLVGLMLAKYFFLYFVFKL